MQVVEHFAIGSRVVLHGKEATVLAFEYPSMNYMVAYENGGARVAEYVCAVELSPLDEPKSKI